MDSTSTIYTNIYNIQFKESIWYLYGDCQSQKGRLPDLPVGLPGFVPRIASETPLVLQTIGPGLLNHKQRRNLSAMGWLFAGCLLVVCEINGRPISSAKCIKVTGTEFTAAFAKPFSASSAVAPPSSCLAGSYGKWNAGGCLFRGKAKRVPASCRALG